MNYEAGKWYFVDDQDPTYSYIFRCDTDGQIVELYFTDGDTVYAGDCDTVTAAILATSAQIETCLKAYAEKNGYVEGAKVKGKLTGTIWNISIGDFTYFEKDDMLCLAGLIIYKQGEWAGIIQHAPSIQDTQDQELTDKIQEYLTEKDLEKMNVLVNGYSVSLLKCVEVYRKCLEIKKVIG